MAKARPISPLDQFARDGGDLSYTEPLPFAKLLENSRKTVQTPYGECDGNGVNVSLIRENLRLSPHERLLKADIARQAAIEQLAERADEYIRTWQTRMSAPPETLE